MNFVILSLHKLDCIRIREFILKLDKDLLGIIKPSNYDQFRYYPAKSSDSWKKLFFNKLTALINSDSTFFYYDPAGNFEQIVGGRISSWDYDHFGIKMGSIFILCNENSLNAKKSIGLLIRTCIDDFKRQGVQFVSTRIHGDNLDAIHIAEEAGFKYYETIIWPVKNIVNLNHENKPSARLMVESELNRVVEIATSNTYQRSHYHCDPKIPNDKADSMHVKWLTTSWEKGDFISVIEAGEQIAGYFVFGFDEELSNTMGYKYGRMKNLALDKKFRGRGLGVQLFNDTILLMKKMDVEVIDSGYTVKNLQSARLHALNSFIPVYEEVTFHLWL